MNIEIDLSEEGQMSYRCYTCKECITWSDPRSYNNAAPYENWGTVLKGVCNCGTNEVFFDAYLNSQPLEA